MGPDQLARSEAFAERARAAGDTIVWGGRRRAATLHYESTLEPASNSAEIVQHEVFGPVLTLQRFSSEAEAVESANSTRYGLSAIVYLASRSLEIAVYSARMVAPS